MKITIATRGSELALWQARHVKAKIEAVRPDIVCELLPITTTGDKILDTPLADIGGKALFVKEVEQALLDGAADLAVHSMKDVPSDLADGLHMAAISEREDPRDALIAAPGMTVATLPQGAVIGTSSARRQALLAARRPDFTFVLLRGNVPTRIAKQRAGACDATLLAAAGLARLGLEGAIAEYLSIEDSLPAVSQGVLGVETRSADAQTTAIVKQAMHSERQAVCVEAERSFLRAVGGSCKTPLGAYCEWSTADAGKIWLRAMAGDVATREVWRAEVVGLAADATALGLEVASLLRAQGARFA